MHAGTRIALDWGKARIGVAATDVTATLCFPVGTFAPTTDGLDALFHEIDERSPIVVYLGLPMTLSGDEGPAAAAMRTVAHQIAERLAPVPVRLVDERMTTVVAHRALAEAGRNSRQRRNIVDQAAAVAILEQATEQERLSGNTPGELVEGRTT